MISIWFGGLLWPVNFCLAKENLKLNWTTTIKSNQIRRCDCHFKWYSKKQQQKKIFSLTFYYIHCVHRTHRWYVRHQCKVWSTFYLWLGDVFSIGIDFIVIQLNLIMLNWFWVDCSNSVSTTQFFCCCQHRKQSHARRDGTNNSKRNKRKHKTKNPHARNVHFCRQNGFFLLRKINCQRF